jgi:regulator of protease activity HflC (stomatin/prohibitin superfamily)
MTLLFSCATVDSGHKGVEVTWGGETNMKEVYPEGTSSGFHWMFDDMIEYDIREHTLVKKFSFNDRDKMVTTVEVSMDYNLIGEKVNLLHTKIVDVDTKILTSLQSACKEVIPQYSAAELNTSHRVEAENKLKEILSKELPEFYVNLARIRMTDVDLPDGVSDLAEQTAVQIGKNELATKMEAEQVSKAKAKVALAKGDYEASLLNAKTKDLMSQPKMLELKRVENEGLMWEGFLKHGNSPYGENNMFGVSTNIVKGLK